MSLPSICQTPTLPTLLVVNQGDATVSVVDPALGKWTATIYEGVPDMVGHEIATSPDGRLAFLPLYGNSGVGRPGVDGQFLLVIDIAAHKVIKKVDFGRGVRPHGIVYERTANLLYVTTELDKSVTILDPATLKIVGSIPTQEEQSHMLAVSHDGRRGYTANVSSGTVSVLDLQNRKFLQLIPVSSSTQRISVSPDDSLVFTADQVNPRLAVIDTRTNRVAGWVQLPSIGYGTAASSDSHWLLVTLPSAGEVALVDLRSRKVVRTLEVGPRPQEVLLDPDGKTAYVSCFGGSHVAEIDLTHWKVTSQIEVGQRADGMAWAKPQ